jgi:hypothetical protein
MKIVLLALALLSATPLPGLAADDQYVDDRSNAAALVRSLYNAVSRKEYGRAWSYYGDQKPAKTLDKFAEGYADTARVDVATGGVSEEGAAGSTFYQVAVAIQATNKNGDVSVFAGCYTARLANPQIQGEAFSPLHLEKGCSSRPHPMARSAMPFRQVVRAARRSPRQTRSPIRFSPRSRRPTAPAAIRCSPKQTRAPPIPNCMC